MAMTTYLQQDLAVAIPASARTLDGFRRWALSDAYPEVGRISFIEREVLVDMSPERLEVHSKVKHEIARVLGNICKTENMGDYYPDGTLLIHDDAELCTEPDGTYVSFESVRNGRARLSAPAGDEDMAMHIEGSPDWVCEVVSDSSVRKDLVMLRRAYHVAGVREYWLIDARHDELAFTILLHQPDGYAVAEGVDGWQTSQVFDRQFRLERRRNAIGRWDYTLLEQK